MTLAPNSDELIHRYLDGVATPEEVAALSDLLETSPETRDLYVRLADVHATLAVDQTLGGGELIAPLTTPPLHRSRGWLSRWAPVAASLIVGLFFGSMVWAYAMPMRPDSTLRSLPLVDASFETPVHTGDGPPAQPGRWDGDSGKVVSAEQGITPCDGHNMFRFLRSDSTADQPGGLSHVGDLFQIIDLRSVRQQLGSGERQTLEVSAAFNGVPALAGEKFLFGCLIYGRRGSPEEFRSQWPITISEAPVVGGTHVVADNDPATWQRVRAEASLTGEVDYVVVHLKVLRMSPQPSATPVEFRGHYVDDVQAVLRTGSSTVTARHVLFPKAP